MSAFNRCLCPDGVCQSLTDFDWSNDCDMLMVSMYSGVVCLVVMAVVALLFPCCFFCARSVCNCCGGKYATHGCCCTEPSTRDLFPGYKNRTIVLTKVMMLVAAIGTGVVYGHMVHQNTQVHPLVQNTIGGAKQALMQVQQLVVAADMVMGELVALPTSYIEDGAVTHEQVQQLSQALNDGSQAKDRVNQVFGDISSAEDQYRNPLVTHVPIVGLVAVGIALLCALVNFRKVVGVCVALLSIATGLVLLLLAGMAAITTTASMACNNMDTTLLPVLVQTAASNGACGGTGAMQEVNAAVQHLNAYVGNSESAFCKDLAVVCAEQGQPELCGAGVCGLPASSSSSTSESAGETLIRNNMAIESALYGTNATSSASQTPAWQRVFQMTQLLSRVVFLQEIATATLPCDNFATNIQYMFAQPLCGSSNDMAFIPSTKRHLGITTGLIAGVFGMFVFSLCVMVRGMKRFRARNTYAVDAATAADVQQALLVNETAAFVDMGAAAASQQQAMPAAMNIDAAYPPVVKPGQSYGAVEASSSNTNESDLAATKEV